MVCVDHVEGERSEPLFDGAPHRLRDAGGSERLGHEGEPALGCLLIDDEGEVTPTQPRVPVPLGVEGRTAEPLNEEELQLLAAGAKVLRIDGPKDRVSFDAVVEVVDRPLDGLATSGAFDERGLLSERHALRIPRLRRREPVP